MFSGRSGDQYLPTGVCLGGDILNRCFEKNVTNNSHCFCFEPMKKMIVRLKDLGDLSGNKIVNFLTISNREHNIYNNCKNTFVSSFKHFVIPYIFR